MEMLSLKRAFLAQWAPPAQHLLSLEGSREEEGTGQQPEAV